MSQFDDLRDELTRLEHEERPLSQRRRLLHRKIEFVRGTGAHDPNATTTLAALVIEEAEVSARRRQVHREIDRIRAELRLDGTDGPRLLLPE